MSHCRGLRTCKSLMLCGRLLLRNRWILTFHAYSPCICYSYMFSQYKSPKFSRTVVRIKLTATRTVVCIKLPATRTVVIAFLHFSYEEHEVLKDFEGWIHVIFWMSEHWDMCKSNLHAIIDRCLVLHLSRLHIGPARCLRWFVWLNFWLYWVENVV